MPSAKHTMDVHRNSCWRYTAGGRQSVAGHRHTHTPACYSHIEADNNNQGRAKAWNTASSIRWSAAYMLPQPHHAATSAVEGAGAVALHTRAACDLLHNTPHVRISPNTAARAVRPGQQAKHCKATQTNRVCQAVYSSSPQAVSCLCRSHLSPMSQPACPTQKPSLAAKHTTSTHRCSTSCTRANL